ncbi:TetR/AcrR family transcriptional regulator [Wenjunlia tyrosinilytica]|uniref:TetR family transcriptional regulator n=1 Tax=Wenjunlia tyrosinilytica TaxID=1544741 RepID=A0A917ZSI2_9ACTN|nr:TetR/AcrR family transcriptional regulator [Wenjunlia tyrosinilytica]GGO91067.1 TetR family transcriptional regulator [Wenjunlia tyrosinilytica]
MSPRSASVNEEMRRRSRDRLLQATVELVDERGYERTTLGDIADRAGTARGLISYYFPGKRQLLQSAVHRLMSTEVEAALEAEPKALGGRERMARVIDCVLGMAVDRPTLFRTHMAMIIDPDAAGFQQCSEQQKLAQLLKDTVIRYGTEDPVDDYRLLRALLMGGVVGLLLPGAELQPARIRAELFRRYGLDWDQGTPSTAPPPAWPPPAWPAPWRP